jgi:hypothetical protein
LTPGERLVIFMAAVALMTMLICLASVPLNRWYAARTPGDADA